MPDKWKVLHQDALVIDGHMDTLSRIHSQSSYGKGPMRSLVQGPEDGHVNIQKLKTGGVTAIICATYVESPFVPDQALRHVIQMIGYAHQQIDSNDSLLLVRKPSDILKAKRTGRIGIILGIEGGEPIGTSLQTLRSLHELGVRNIGLTWNHRNLIGGGPWEKGGLSAFGVNLVKEMNRLGITVDVSHLNIEGFWNVIETTSRPIVASHSNARAVTDHPRNLKDDQIQALAKNGGVMGMNFCAAFLNKNESKAALSDVLDHIDHIAELVGVEHIALGSDFDGIEKGPKELKSVSDMPLITRGLAERGYGDAEIRKILGENFLRVMRRSWSKK